MTEKTKKIPHKKNTWSWSKFTVKFILKLQLLQISLHFFLLLFLNFSLLDPNQGGKMNTDPDPQPWFLLIQITSICIPPPAGALPRPWCWRSRCTARSAACARSPLRRLEGEKNVSLHWKIFRIAQWAVLPWVHRISPMTAVHRRRIYKEEKAKVVVAVWGNRIY